MKKMNKKGFTIVELVIVIAVIAIMSAVLIPTFSGIIKKSKRSADQQAVANMNKIIATSTEELTTIDDVMALLIEENYNAEIKTYYKDYKLAWVKAEKAIVIVEDNAVVYPEEYAGKTLAYEELNPTVVVDSAKDLTNNLTSDKVVYLKEDVKVDAGLATSKAGTYEVNLNSNKLEASSYVGSWVDGAKLSVSNGIIDATNSSEKIAVYADEGGIVELTNVQVYAAAGKNPLQCYGGTMILNNVTTAQTGEADVAWYNSAIQVVNNITYPEKDPVTNKHVIYGDNANLTVNGGMYSAKRAIQISAPGGNVTITDGTFIGTEYAIKAEFAPQYYTHTEGKTYESVITISGGNFTGNISVSAATVVKISGGTFSVEPKAEWIVAGYKVVENNGTYSVVKA